jgi:type III pantothenate kinase
MMETKSDPQLAIDIGNTAIKMAVFRDGAVIGPLVRLTKQEWEVADRLVTNHEVKNIIYSTVANVPPTRWIDKWNDVGIPVLELTAGLPLPFTSDYLTMETLGKDRIAAVAGSLALPASAAPATAPLKVLPARLIVDAGTCITLDLIDGQRRYLGGNISPGVRMRLRAMHEMTARLPLIDPAPGPARQRVGRTTETALRHGGQLGAVYEVEGFYRRLLTDYPDLELVLTGGDAELLASDLNVPCVIYPNLVLFGLHQILSYYVQNES